MHLGPSDGPLGALSFLGWVVNHAPRSSRLIYVEDLGNYDAEKPTHLLRGHHLPHSLLGHESGIEEQDHQSWS